MTEKKQDTFAYHREQREFEVKHEGEELIFSTGMHRNSSAGKPNYALIDLVFLTRLANHLTKGAEIHGKNNWRLACTEEELERFMESAFRHLIQWLNSDMDEDHMAAVCFNLMAAEYVKDRLLNDDQASSVC